MQYIGITSIGVRERWYAHISCSRSLSSNNPIYKDMKEFGETSFEIHEKDKIMLFMADITLMKLY